MMGDFFKRNIEISERLFEAMRADHFARQADMEIWTNTCKSLLGKLEARDREIRKLRVELATLKGEPLPWRTDLTEHYIENPGERANRVPELAEADE
jgi:hypothetical protein